MTKNVAEDKLINGIMNKNAKNMFINVLNNYSIVIVTPLFILLIYNYIIYKYVYLTLNNAQINNDSSFFLGLAIFAIITSSGSFLLVISLGIFTNFFFHFIINKIYHLPLNHYKVFLTIENKVLRILIIPYCIYLVFVCIAFKLTFIECIMYSLFSATFYCLASKFSNKITFLLSSFLTNLSSEIKISFNHFFILFQFIFIVIFMKTIVWFQSDIINRYLYFLLLGFGLFMGNIIINVIFSKLFSVDYVIKSKYKRRAKSVKEKRTTKDVSLEFLTIDRNYRIYIDYLVVTMIIITLINFFKLSVDYVTLVLVISCIVSPMILGIIQFFNLDLTRLPLKKIKMKLVIITFSVALAIFPFMILTIVSGEIVVIKDIILFFILIFTSIALQLVLKFKYDPSTEENNILFYAFFGFVAQVLVLVLYHVSLNNLFIILVGLLVFLFVIIVIGGKYETT